VGGPSWILADASEVAPKDTLVSCESSRGLGIGLPDVGRCLLSLHTVKPQLLEAGGVKRQREDSVHLPLARRVKACPDEPAAQSVPLVVSGIGSLLVSR
jgi:hypothetical protein